MINIVIGYQDHYLFAVDPNSKDHDYERAYYKGSMIVIDDHVCKYNLY